MEEQNMMGGAPMQEVPASPAGAPTGIPEGGGELSQEEMKGNLQSLMGKIDGQYQNLNSQMFAGDAKLQQQKSDIFRELFDLFLSLGVDPSSPEDVKKFLDGIKESNPELYQKLSQVLDVLLGQEEEIE